MAYRIIAAGLTLVTLTVAAYLALFSTERPHAEAPLREFFATEDEHLRRHYQELADYRGNALCDAVVRLSGHGVVGNIERDIEAAIVFTKPNLFSEAVKSQESAGRAELIRTVIKACALELYYERRDLVGSRALLAASHDGSEDSSWVSFWVAYSAIEFGKEWNKEKVDPKHWFRYASSDCILTQLKEDGEALSARDGYAPSFARRIQEAGLVKSNCVKLGLGQVQWGQ